MLNIKKILCAVDFSQISEKVAAYARSLAIPLNAEIVAIHVVPYGTIFTDYSIPMGQTETLRTTMIKESKKNLAEFSEKHFAGAKVRDKVICGDLVDQILECAKEEHVDLIVIGTHGRRGVDRMLFGSVAEGVLRRASCPVVTIRPQSAEIFSSSACEGAA